MSGIGQFFIKMNGEDIRMILSGNKSQMRIPVRQSSDEGGDLSPPYSVGDILGIKETWAYLDGKYIYRADPENEAKKILWVQSTRIPEEAIRLFFFH